MTGGFVQINRSDVAGFDGPMIAVWYRLNDWALWGAGTRRVAGKAFALERGQLVTTAASLAANLGFGRQVVRRCLATLERLGRIATRATHRTATVITIRGYGSATCVPTSHLEQPTSTSASTTTSDTPPETLDGQPFHDVEPIGQLLDQPQAQPPYEKGISKKVNPNPPNAGAREAPGRGGGEQEAVTDVEADLLVYAQEQLGRIASPMEIRHFVAAWRSAKATAPWLRPERVRADVDWLAAHPRARRDTRWLSRVFFVEQARRECAAWDDQVRELIEAELGRGVPLDDLADALADQTPSMERGVMRSYVLNLGALYRPRALA